MTIEITQDHIERIQYVARQLAGPYDPDELESQGLLVLWELALTYNEERGASFTTYLMRMGRYRLIDFLRRDTGSRTPGWRPPISLDAMIEEESENHPRDHTPDELVDPSPPVEEVVLAREDLHQLGEFLRSDTLTDEQIECLLWPAMTGTRCRPEALPGDRAEAQRAAHQRRVAKNLACEAIGRPVEPGQHRHRSRRTLVPA